MLHLELWAKSTPAFAKTPPGRIIERGGRCREILCRFVLVALPTSSLLNAADPISNRLGGPRLGQLPAPAVDSAFARQMHRPTPSVSYARRLALDRHVRSNDDHRSRLGILILDWKAAYVPAGSIARASR